MCHAQVKGLPVVLGCSVFVGLLFTVPLPGKRVSVLFAHTIPARPDAIAESLTTVSRTRRESGVVMGPILT